MLNHDKSFFSEERIFTITIFAENHIGLLNRVTVIITRRHLNIESITVSQSEVKGIHHFNIVLRTTHEKANKVVKQLEKVVEVLKAFVHEENQMVFQEIALYKISYEALNFKKIEKLVKDNNARILKRESEYLVIEKTGHEKETRELLNKLQPFGILEFARSGRVAVTKSVKGISAYLEEMHEQN